MPAPTRDSSRTATLRQQPCRPASHATIHRIIEGATSAVLATQQAAPRIAEIARRSQLARSAIYRYFPGREAIRDAIFGCYVARRLDEYRAMLDTLPDDADTRDICATTAMAILRASTAASLGPLSRHIRAQFVEYAQRNDRPLVRGMAGVLSAFLEQRDHLRQHRVTVDELLAVGMALKDMVELLALDDQSALSEADTAHKLTDFLHRALFQRAG